MPIFYWKGASGEQALRDEHKTAIRRLITGDYSPSDLEQLKGNTSASPIYSFRLNGTARLIFTTRIINKIPHLHILECLETHDYHKCRFLKKGILDRHLKQLLTSNEASTTLDSFFETIEDSNVPAFDAEDELKEPVPLDYFNQQFVQLSSNQHESLHTPLPHIILGAAGSGKTLLALSLLRQFIDTNHSEEAKRILYVTQKKELVKQIKEAWSAFYLQKPDEEASILVDILTYDELHQQIVQKGRIDDTPTQHKHTPNPFQTWGSRVKRGELDIDNHLLHQEFRICSAHIREEYIGLGEHQSSIHNEAQRGLIYDRYLNYRTYLDTHDLKDPIFDSLTDEQIQLNRYDRVVVDEAQNFSLVQQDNLARLAKHDAIAFCMDPLQNTVDQCAMRPLLVQRYYRSGISLHTTHLRQTFRCSRNIAHVVTSLMKAEQHLMSHIDKEAETAMSVDERVASSGEVYLTKNRDLHHFETILARASSNHFAVITSAENIERTKVRFKTQLVFTPEQIQGLEYHTVLVYQLFAEPHAQHLLKQIGPKLKTARNKSMYMENQAFAPWLHRLYIAYTRAQHTLLICEEESPQVDINGLLDWITASLPRHQEDLSEEAFQRMHRTDWHAEIKQQLQKNTPDSIERAYDIARDKKINIDEIIHEITATPPVESSHLNVSSNSPQIVTHTENVGSQSLVLASKPKKKSPPKPSPPKPLTPHEINALELYNALSRSPDASLTIRKFRSQLHRLLLQTTVRHLDLDAPLIYHLSDLGQERSADLFSSILLNQDALQLALKMDEELSLPTQIQVMICMHLCKKEMKKLTVQQIQWLLNKSPIFVKQSPPVSSEFISTLFVLIEKRQKNITMNQIRSLLSLFDSHMIFEQPLYFLIKHDLALFNALLKRDKKLLAHISPLAWSCNEKDYTQSALSLLTFSSKTKDILKQLLNYPEVIQQIHLDTWIPVIEELASTSGIEIIDRLLREHPSIVHHALIQNTKIVCRLAANPAGLAILTSLFNNHPDVIRNIPAASWGIINNESTIQKLCSSEEGLIIVQALLHYPTIIDQIPIEAWTKPTSWITHSSAIERLIFGYTEISQRVLLGLIKNHHDRMNTILPPFFSSGSMRLTHLIISDIGIKILGALVQDYPQLIKNIPIKHWEKTETGQFSTWNFLIAQPNLESILYAILDKYPDLVNAIDPSEWIVFDTYSPVRYTSLEFIDCIKSKYPSVYKTICEHYPDLEDRIEKKVTLERGVTSALVNNNLFAPEEKDPAAVAQEKLNPCIIS